MTTPHGIFYGNRVRSFVIAAATERSATWVTPPIYVLGARAILLSYIQTPTSSSPDYLGVEILSRCFAAGGSWSDLGGWISIANEAELVEGSGHVIWTPDKEDHTKTGIATIAGDIGPVVRHTVIPAVIRIRFNHQVTGTSVFTYSAGIQIL